MTLSKKKLKKLLKKGENMCKVMSIIGVPKDKRELVWKFAEAAAMELSSGRDTDGFGYAAITEKGEIFSEKWLHNKDAFKVRTEIDAKFQSILAKLADALYLIKTPYAYQGVENRADAASIILHARLSTNQVCIENTHPFISEDGKTALIHNGVIANQEQLSNFTSTCDSECILNSYLDNGTDIEPENIQGLADEVRGSWACAVLGDSPKGPYVDMFRNDTNPLVMAKIKELDCLVFCTTAQIIEDTAKRVGMTVEFNMMMKSNWLIRFDAVTGEVKTTVPFKYELGSGYGNSGRRGGGHSNVQSFRGTAHSGPSTTATAGASTEKVNDEDISEKDIEDLLMRNPRMMM